MPYGIPEELALRRSRRVRKPLQRPVRSANERLKERWGACLTWSMAAAAAAHLALFAAWPAYEVAQQTRSTPLLVAQLVPIASRGILPDPPPAPAAAPPTSETPEVVRDAQEDLLEEIYLPPPSLVYPDHPTPPDAPPVGMIAKPISAVGADPPLATLMFSWPELRNPRTVVRFLRRGYNLLALEKAAERYVIVKISLNKVGVVEWCEVYQSSGHPALDQLALAVINEIAQFTPGSSRGLPIPVVVELLIPFEQPW